MAISGQRGRGLSGEGARKGLPAVGCVFVQRGSVDSGMLFFQRVVCALQVFFDTYQILHSKFKSELKHYH